ncbi:branched-chain amino acid ABC transporter permease [Gulosibacter molinativorax]|uniref:Branched-chain amino acid ABC transporter permease n=1 Tax=Gulosibacter molinativorax TaxID=256821 RepID=A0ABT7C875_9MICO|nr:branched-chain amino acid ABC transporter permease [Gulosibacter molinativorax]MDJ1371390.1 branched-chain amino acid ABC transporter permease [Gulosibacter molinativorax]QUY62888.1 Putative ABC transporter permiase component [Gulosibacter molinativorax]
MQRLKPFIPLAVIAIGVIAYTLTGPSRLSVDLINTILIFATFATAWNIAGGMTGLFSLGHGALFAVGAFGTTLLRLNLGIPTIPAMLLSALMAVVVALFIGLISLRLRGHYFALATLGLAVIVYIALQNFSDLTGGDEGIPIPKDTGFWNLIFQTKEEYVYLTLGLYVITAAIVIYLRRSRLGYQMNAVKEDEVSARAIGIPAVRTKMFAVALSGFFTALAGSVFAQYTLYITPANVGSVNVTWEPALMAIIGGMVGVFGPLVGSTLITLLDHFVVAAIGAAVPGLSSLIYGVLLIVTILLLPNGIVGVFRKAFDWVRNKVTHKRSPSEEIPTSAVVTLEDQALFTDTDSVLVAAQQKEDES